MKILIPDDSCERNSRLVAEFMAGFGHSVLYKTNTKSSDFVEKEYKQEDFGLVIKDLNKFIKDEITPAERITEEIEYHITDFFSTILKDARLEKSLSMVELGNLLVALKKSGKLKFPLLTEKNAAKLVGLFESGEFCPPHGYLYTVAGLCSQELRLEDFLGALEIGFGNQDGMRDRRSTTIALMDIYYKKHAQEIEKKVNPSNPTNSNNLLDFHQHKKLKFKKEGRNE